MSELKKYYIDEIAADLTQKLIAARKKHHSINCYCILVEGDRFHALVPKYVNEKEKLRETRRFMELFVDNPDCCARFAEIIVPPARFHEREAKKKQKCIRNK